MDFRQIINNLLFLKKDYGKLYETVQNYYSLLSQITGIDENSIKPEDDRIKSLKTGEAISPKDAARCILDFARTTKFLRGIYSAICQAKKNFPNEKIQILYAGCGPFAALAIPQCAKFTSDEIAFTLIDIHQRSIDSAKKIFREFGFEDHIEEFIKTDAAVYQKDRGKKFHIIVTETMQKTLEKEPQVAITLNLINQLRTNGFFIPQKITISACLANIKKEFAFINEIARKNARIPLGTVLELPYNLENIFEPKRFLIPDGNIEEMQIMLLTEIQIFEELILQNYVSGITYPTILHDLGNPKNGSFLKIQYVVSENPHFEYELL